jgi:type II secretory ATPase GspE/PulE/Tfp pilus assembly ATPase PilB-like protein
MVSVSSNPTFLERLRGLSQFEDSDNLKLLLERHGESLELVQAVIDEKLVPKEAACRSWGDAQGVAYVDPFASVVTEEAVGMIPHDLAQKALALGLYVIDGMLTVAMAEPANDRLVERLSNAIQAPISPVFALPKEIRDAICVNYSSDKSIEESVAMLGRLSVFDRSDRSIEYIPPAAEHAAVAPLLDDIIHFSFRERATDIHIEALETHSRIRFRVDGNLREILTYPRKLHRALVTRLKVLADLNVAEARFPQDGRFSMPLGSQTAHFRLSLIPSSHGEKAVIRVMAMSGRKSTVTLESMLMSRTVLHPLRRLLSNPSGLIFVTGPTGSGKTTTLYAALQELNQGNLNISTIEDPVEIHVAGITQSQTNDHIDLKFQTLLRSLLRQDPDVILIGEIRDPETAKIAAEAALTGHAVLSTLHTNNAAQAVVRLMDIGVPPYLVAPSISGVLAQRLAARICESCREAYYPPKATMLKYFEEEGLEEVPFYRGRGCPACRGTGFKGRIAFHEIIVVTEEIRSLIAAGKGSQEITAAARKVGHRSLRYDGLKKVLLGLTTIEEIEQNCPLEWAS